jgi:hypothetical protein
VVHARPIADRTKENLGASDNGIALYRRVLRREIKKVEEGVDPMFTFRDAARTRASTCRTSARSTTTARRCGAGSCARTRPIRRSPRT